MSFISSLIFAILQIAAAVFIYHRANNLFPHDHFIHSQWRFLPFLVTMILIQLLEALLWYRHENGIDTLVSITKAKSSYEPNPSSANEIITKIIVLALLPLQPFFAIWACRMAGNKTTQDLLSVPQMLSIVYFISNLISIINSNSIGNYPQVSSSSSSLEESNFSSYRYTKTCTWIGKSGHYLQWTNAFDNAWFMPTPYTYFLLFLSVTYARPWAFGSGIITFLVVLWFIQIAYFGGSFESTSVWSLSGLVLSAYLLLQPHYLSCEQEEFYQQERKVGPYDDVVDDDDDDDDDNNKDTKFGFGPDVAKIPSPPIDNDDGDSSKKDIESPSTTSGSSPSITAIFKKKKTKKTTSTSPSKSKTTTKKGSGSSSSSSTSSSATRQQTSEETRPLFSFGGGTKGKKEKANKKTKRGSRPPQQQRMPVAAGRGNLSRQQGTRGERLLATVSEDETDDAKGCWVPSNEDTT